MCLWAFSSEFLSVATACAASEFWQKTANYIQHTQLLARAYDRLSARDLFCLAGLSSHYRLVTVTFAERPVEGIATCSVL